MYNMSPIAISSCYDNFCKTSNTIRLYGPQWSCYKPKINSAIHHLLNLMLFFSCRLSSSPAHSDLSMYSLHSQRAMPLGEPVTNFASRIQWEQYKRSMYTSPTLSRGLSPSGMPGISYVVQFTSTTSCLLLYGRPLFKSRYYSF